MKIVQVATLFTPENAYGGPTTVALGHCRGLIEVGHDVTLVAGAQGYTGPLPTRIQGVPVKLFPVQRVLPKAGFAGLTSVGLLAWLRKQLPTVDALHVHLARDLVTLPAAGLALAAKVPLFAQTHGMIDPSDNPLAKPLDAALTRRVLRAAKRVFFLTDADSMSDTDVDTLLEETGKSRIQAVEFGRGPARHGNAQVGRYVADQRCVDAGELAALGPVQRRGGLGDRQERGGDGEEGA